MTTLEGTIGPIWMSEVVAVPDPHYPFVRRYEDGLPTRWDRIEWVIDGVERTFYDLECKNHPDATLTMLHNHLDALRWWGYHDP